MLQGGTNMAQHVGQQVEITGRLAQGSSSGAASASGSGSQSSSVGTTGTSSSPTLQVSSVRTISNTCSR